MEQILSSTNCPVSNFWSIELSQFYSFPWRMILNFLGCQALVREKALNFPCPCLAPEGMDALFWFVSTVSPYPALFTSAVKSLQEGRIQASCSPEGVVPVEGFEDRDSSKVKGRHRFACKCYHIPVLWLHLLPWDREPPWTGFWKANVSRSDSKALGNAVLKSLWVAFWAPQCLVFSVPSFLCSVCSPTPSHSACLWN